MKTTLYTLSPTVAVTYKKWDTFTYHPNADKSLPPHLWMAVPTKRSLAKYCPCLRSNVSMDDLHKQIDNFDRHSNTMKCKQHPTYKAIRKPRTHINKPGCKCWDIYIKKYGRNGR